MNRGARRRAGVARLMLIFAVLAALTAVQAEEWPPLALLGDTVPPGARRDLEWTAGESFAGTAIDTPVIVVRGQRPGPTLCLTAAIHGDELNGVEIVRRVLLDLEPGELAGTIIGVPVVNLLGFARGSRYLPDRRDLNRYFPGHPRASSAARIAHAFFEGVVRHCEYLIDFHTASFKRSNLPQLRANLARPQELEFARQFGATSAVHIARERGTLRNAATAAGIPAVAFELGQPGTLQLEHVEYGVAEVEIVMGRLGMLERHVPPTAPQPLFERSRWLRAVSGGILTSTVEPGAWVREGDVLGIIINPLTSESSELRSPYSGRILGRALNQLVLPGFAAFHIGLEGTDFRESRRPTAGAVSAAGIGGTAAVEAQPLTRSSGR